MSFYVHMYDNYFLIKKKKCALFMSFSRSFEFRSHI